MLIPLGGNEVVVALYYRNWWRFCIKTLWNRYMKRLTNGWNRIWSLESGLSSFIDLEKLGTKMGFPGGTVVKNLPANAGDARDASSISGLGISPEGGNGNPRQCSCWEKSHGQGSLADCNPWGPNRIGHNWAAVTIAGIKRAPSICTDLSLCLHPSICLSAYKTVASQTIENS